MREDLEIEEWISLHANCFGHFLQVDPVEAEAWVRAQRRDDLLPERDEAVRIDVIGKAGGQ